MKVEAGTFDKPVGTKIGRGSWIATVTSPQDFEGNSANVAATTGQVCLQGQKKVFAVDVRGSIWVMLAAVLEHADMTTKQLCEHGDAWCVPLASGYMYLATKEVKREVGPGQYALGKHRVKIDNINHKLSVDGEVVLDLPKGKAFRLAVATFNSDCKISLGSVKTEQTGA